MSKRYQMREDMRIVKVARYATRLLLAVVMGLALVGFLPAATAQAETNPVDLELGGDGATSWNIINIQPVDSGTKTVELHNAGSKDGFITIWVSDIVSGEGMNPESETGNTTEPGEIADYLLVNLTADGLSSNADLPTTINNLPKSSSWSNYIDIIPLKTGDTINLQWEWELPSEAGNDAQGDNLSFTINYLLREFSITDVSDVVTDEGVFTEEVTAESEGGKAELVIEKDTIALTAEGEPLSEIWIIDIEKEPSAPSEDTSTVGSHYYFGPAGATFDRPITITVTYDPGDIPARAIEENLVIVLWDEDAGEWLELEGCTVDLENNTISVAVDHFSRYTVIAHVPPPPRGSIFYSTPRPIGKPSPPSQTLEVYMLGKTDRLEIGADGTLRESLTLTDRSRNFILDIDGGTKVTGSGDVELSRIELRITDESVVVPDDIVVVSPIYKLTGYTRNMEITRINLEPPARLTITYDPQNLPENTFLPFIANYTDEEGLVQLQPSPGETVEIGKAKAQISHASLFFVAAKLIPAPPPLPPKFQVSNLIISPRQGKMGQPVVISLEIANDGETTGSYELQLKLDGIVRMVREITLAAKSSEIVSFEIHNLSVGRHQVKVAGQSGQFRIVSTAISPVESTIDWLTLDLSIGAVVVIGLLTLYLIRRRS